MLEDDEELKLFIMGEKSMFNKPLGCDLSFDPPCLASSRNHNLNLSEVCGS